VAINKFDKRGSQDALRDVKKQYTRNHNLWDADPEGLPVFGTIASQFNDPGMNSLYKVLLYKLEERTESDLKSNVPEMLKASDAVRLRARGRPRASRIIPRAAGVTISRVPFSAAAVR
jgi:putative protein kinase ArgK-like GTPase of G3E family